MGNPQWERWTRGQAVLDWGAWGVSVAVVMLLTALALLALLAGEDRVERQPVAVAFALCIFGVFLAGAARIADLKHLWRWYGVVYLVLTGLSFPALALGIYGAHDTYPEAAAFFLQTSVFCWFSLRRAIAAVTTVLVCLTALVVVLAADGLTGTSLVRWLCVALPVLSVSILLGPQPAIAAQASRAAEAAQAELADVNAGLELRVAEQVEEIERGRALRRFLSPEVADVVLADDALLRPHRREVAVFFCDLRGFTAFTSRAEPEDVVRIVSEYYEAVGDIIRQHGATIGGYAGDGIMAYVGDPLPTPDPAAIALRMAAEVRDTCRVLTSRWRARGDDLGVGIGIAVGHATLGVVGAADRRDYVALGSVVNLAARLCGEAGDDEVLVDQRAAAGAGIPLRNRAALKGFGEVAVYALP